MKLKNTFILLLVAAGLAAFIFLYERYQPTSKEAKERAGRVVQFDRDKVDAITIKNPEATIELRKKDGNWSIESPVKDRADSIAVAALFTAAEGLRSESSLGDDKKGVEKDQQKDFGVSNSATRVKFTGAEKPVELLLGKDTAVEGKIYARLEGENTVHVIRNDLRAQLSKKPDDFRDRKLTDLVATQVSRLQIQSSLGEIELVRKDQHWSLVKPLKARGDSQKIGDLIAQISNAHIESFVADSTNASAFGLQEPRGTVTLYVEGSDKPTVLQIGQLLEKEKDKIYARLSTRDSVYVLPKSVETVLETKPNDLRDRNLVRFESDIVDRINLEAPGREKIVLARSGETWVRKAQGKDLPINNAAATKLLSGLQSQQVTAFVADVASDLPKYGLDQPQVRLTLSSYASENTAETKAGEKPIVSVLFGRTEEGSTYTKVEDEPFIVSVPRAVLELAMTDPLQWQELTVFKYKPEELLTLEIAREGLPTLSLSRDKDKLWKLVKGDGTVNQINVQSAVNTLSSLRAARWVGATVPEHGLSKPTLTAKFTVGGNFNRTLTIGANSPEDLSYAMADGLPGTFALSRPDVTALQLPLLDKAAPPAQPASDGAAPSAAPERSPAESNAPASNSSPDPSVPSAPAPATEAPATPAAPAPATPLPNSSMPE